MIKQIKLTYFIHLCVLALSAPLFFNVELMCEMPVILSTLATSLG
jgi:hypothetical protein